MKKFFLIFALLSFIIQLKAVTIDIGDLRYTVDTEAQTAQLSGPVSSSKVINNLVIPDFIEYEGVQIPVISIRDQAFYKNTNLRGSLTIGNKIQIIGDHAFYECSGLTGSLTIPADVQTIGNYAFRYCSGFTGSLNIQTSVVTIGDYAFSNCSGFTRSLIIPDNVQTIGEGAFYHCWGFTGSLTIGDNIQTIGKYAFSGCRNLTGELTIPNSVITIGDNAFSNCLGFTGSLTIPDNVQTIGKNAFYACTGFTGSLTIGNNVQTIGNSAFSECRNLTGELTIPMSVKEIGTECFINCQKLTSLVITSSNTVINIEAFFDCYDLESVTCLGLIPPKCVYGSIGPFTIDYAFSTMTYNKPLYVPSVSLDLYKNATEWEKFKYINPIPVEAKAISLNKNELNLFVGQEETLIATLTPEDATTEIVWSTEENNIISVDQTGKVTALAVGEAKVKATAGEVSAICKITVNPILATSISIDGNNTHILKQTETLQLTATIIPESTTYQEITWTSSDESKATVSNSGLVTAIEEGVVEIIATLSYQPQVNTSYDITIQKRLLGDANDNGIVNVADVGTISDYIVEKPVYNFCFVNADVVTDGRITTADVTATVDIIFNDTPSMAIYAKARKIYANGNNELIVDNFSSSASSLVDVNLKNPADFTGLQGSIIIPEGVTIKNVTKGAGASNHILNYNFTDHGTIEFILYSLQNASFDNMGSLIELEIQAERHSDDLIVENILASDSAANEYSLSFSGGKNNDFTTSLDTFDDVNILIYSSSNGVVILNAQGENVNIFNIAGERIVTSGLRTNKEFYPLASGIYIVTVKTETAKIIVK